MPSTYSDLCCGIDGLISIVKFDFQWDLYEKDILSCSAEAAVNISNGLFGKTTDFLLLYKRLEFNGFSWPVQKKEEALEMTPEQYQALLRDWRLYLTQEVKHINLL